MGKMVSTKTGTREVGAKSLKRTLIWLTAIVVFFSTYFYVPPEYSDLGRYYYLIETLSSFNNILYAVALQQEQDIDFIFPLLMLGALKLGIKLQFVTALVCSIYWAIIANVFFQSVNKVNNLVFIYFLGVVCFPNMMDVIGTARNVMAFLFLFKGFQNWLNTKKIWAVICFILSVFTHFSCLIHIFLFFLVLIIYKYLLSKHPKITNLLCLFLPVLMYLFGATLINDFFMSPFMRELFGDSAGYGSYVSREVEAVTYNFVGIGQMAFLLSHIVFLYFLINIDKGNSLQRALVMVFFSMITLSYACTYNLLVRFNICIAFFYSQYASESITCLKNKKLLIRPYLAFSSVILILVFLWNYHGLIMKYWQF